MLSTLPFNRPEENKDVDLPFLIGAMNSGQVADVADQAFMRGDFERAVNLFTRAAKMLDRENLSDEDRLYFKGWYQGKSSLCGLKLGLGLTTTGDMVAALDANAH